MKRGPQLLSRRARAELNKQSLIVDALFKPLEAHGFKPSHRSIRSLLSVLGVPIGDHELNRILRPWLAAAAAPGNGSRNGIRAQTQRIGEFRNELKIPRNGIRAQTQRIKNSAQRPPDSPVRPNLINKRPPLANPSPKGAPLLPQGAIPNDEAELAAAAARAERFRIARELLAETERRNREASRDEKEPAPLDAVVDAPDADAGQAPVACDGDRLSLNGAASIGDEGERL